MFAKELSVGGVRFGLLIDRLSVFQLWLKWLTLSVGKILFKSIEVQVQILLGNSIIKIQYKYFFKKYLKYCYKFQYLTSYKCLKYWNTTWFGSASNDTMEVGLSLQICLHYSTVYAIACCLQNITITIYYMVLTSLMLVLQKVEDI